MQCPSIGRSIDASKRKLFRACHGGALSIADLKKIQRGSDGFLMLSPEETVMTRELRDHGRTVLLSADDFGACLFFDEHVVGDRDADDDEKTRGLSDSFWLIDRLDKRDLTPLARALYERVVAGLEAIDYPARRIQPVNLLGDSPRELVVAAVLDSKLTADRTIKLSSHPDAKRILEVGIDVRGTAWRQLSELSGRAPRLALTQAIRWICLETVGGGGLQLPLAEAVEEALR